MSKLNKKGQGMPLNVIIIAALVMVVLVVLITIFSGQTRKTVLTLESCGGVGGRCTKEGDVCSPSTEIEKSDAKCPKPDIQKCCIKVLDNKA